MVSYTYMSYTIRALLISFLVVSCASSTLAAGDPSVSVKRSNERFVSVRYENIPAHSTLSVVGTGGTVVEGVRITRTSGVREVRLPETLREGTYTIQIRSRDSVLASTTFVLDIPAPTCRMTVSDKVAHKGDFVTFRWRSENATSATILGNRAVALHGSERMAVYHAGKKGMTANVIGRGGIGGCSATLIVKE